MIKSLLLKEDFATPNLYKNQKIILDTPILIKALGYEGEFLEKQYCFLNDSWKLQGAKLFAYVHSINEIENILGVSAKWVDSSNCDPSLCSWTTMHFKSIGKTSAEVLEEKAFFREKIKRLGIEEIVTSNPDSNHYWENEQDIKKSIIEEYSIRNRENPRYDIEEWDNIDFDVRSICWTYRLRANNELKKLHQAKYVFVTTNKAIVDAIKKYHTNKYGDYLSPVMTDSYIGMVVISTTPQSVQEYVKTSVLSFCHAAFRPGPVKRRQYIDKVRSLEKQGKITSDDVIILQQNMFSEQSIPPEFNDENYADVLGAAKARLIAEEKARSKLVETELNNKNKQLEQELSEKKEIIEKKAKEEYVRQVIKAKRLYCCFNIIWYITCFIAVAIISFGALFVAFSSLVFPSIPLQAKVIITIAVASFVALTIFDSVLPKFLLLKKVSKKIKQYTAHKYLVKTDDY